MRNKRKWTALLVSICLAGTMLFTGCSSSSGSDSGKTKEAKEVSTKDDSKEKKKVSIDEQVLYDENDIKITATGIDVEDTVYGAELKLLIENNSSQDITVQTGNVSVNGYMMSAIMSANVVAGKKANDTLTFYSSELEECGIDQIATIEVSFVFLNSDSYETISTSDMITVNTSVADDYQQTYDDSGEVLVDSNGVKIVSKGLSEDDSFWGPGVILYIENNSDQDIIIQTRDVSVNGFMISAVISEDVLAGKKAISAVQFYDQDLEDNGIDDITDVELYFKVSNLESWDTIFDTDVISIKF